MSFTEEITVFGGVPRARMATVTREFVFFCSSLQNFSSNPPEVPKHS